MTFPVAILIGVYGLLFLGLVIMAIAQLILVWKYSEHSFLASFTTGIYIIGGALIIMATFLLLANVDWSQSFEFSVPNFGVTAPTQSL